MILPHQAQQAQQRRVNEFKLCATVESSSSTTESKEEDDEDDDPNMRPYQGEQPTDALSEIFIPNIFAPTMMPGQEAATKASYSKEEEAPTTATTAAAQAAAQAATLPVQACTR